jgi:anti-anti-sigma factor
MEMDHSVQVNPIVHGGPGGMVRIVLAGELDAYAVPTVRAARDAASATPGRLEIDLAGVTVLSVAMVAVLFTAAHRGGGFHLCNASPEVRQVCRASGLSGWLTVDASAGGSM